MSGKTNPKKALLVTSALLCGVVLATGCEPAPDGTIKPAAKAGPARARVGVVVKRVDLGQGRGFLVVSIKGGDVKNVAVSRTVYARCTKGETYPKCANR